MDKMNGIQVVRDKIKECVEQNIKGYDLEGVEFCDEDYELVENLIAKGKSLEDACDEMMQGVRDCLDEGLKDIEEDENNEVDRV